MAAQPAAAARRPGGARRRFEDRCGVQRGIRNERDPGGRPVRRHAARAQRHPHEPSRRLLLGRIHSHRQIHLEHAHRDHQLPLSRTSAAGGGGPHPGVADLVRQLPRHLEHQRHQARRRAAAERLDGRAHGDDSFLHGRPGERRRQCHRIQRDQPQRKLRPLCAPEIRRDLRHLLGPGQRLGLHQWASLGRRRGQLHTGGEQCNLRRRLRAVWPHGDDVRDDRDECIPFRAQSGDQPEPVRRRKSAAAGRSPCGHAAARAQHGRSRDRNPAGNGRRGLHCRRRLSQHRCRGSDGRHREGSRSNQGRERVLSLQAELLRLHRPHEHGRRHLEPPDRPGERCRYALHHRDPARREPGRHAAGGDGQRPRTSSPRRRAGSPRPRPTRLERVGARSGTTRTTRAGSAASRSR